MEGLGKLMEVLWRLAEGLQELVVVCFCRLYLGLSCRSFLLSISDVCIGSLVVVCFCRVFLSSALGVK